MNLSVLYVWKNIVLILMNGDVFIQKVLARMFLYKYFFQKNIKKKLNKTFLF